MEEMAKMESHLSSAAAFMEGGIQEACDDACSICLDDFCESNPAAVTGCKHDFHLQCILEWCQRSAQCPMCWQPISLKDPTSQELLDAIEREKTIRANQTRNTAIFHHPAFGDFELQHLPVGANDSELEERIIQHLAAAAAMGRAHRISRREGLRGRSANQGHPQFLVLSTQANTSSIGSASANSTQGMENESPPIVISASPPASLASIVAENPHLVPHVTPALADQVVIPPSGSNVPTATRPVLSSSRSSAGQATFAGQDSAGPSDLQSFSDSLRSRLNAVSMRYRESLTKSTRGWKERLFSRNNSVTDLSSDVRREVNAGIATVSRMIERLETRESRRASGSSAAHSTEGHSSTEPINEMIPENHNVLLSGSNQSTPYAATSGQN